MKEFSYVIQDAASLQDALDAVLADPAAHDARSTLVTLYGRDADERLLQQSVHTIAQQMPQAVIAGAATSQAIVNGRLTDAALSVSFTLFAASEAAAYLYDFETVAPEDAQATLAGVLAATPDLRAVELISTSGPGDTAPFFDMLANLPKDVEVFGGLAEGRPQKTGHLFLWGDTAARGLLVIVFSGAELHVSVSTSFGWKPLGRQMTITGMKDAYTVQSIDHRPAVEVYQKYLGLGLDEDILTEMLTFPLFLHRDGVTLARQPQVCAPDGSVRFSADLYEGERVQLAYGDPQEILDTADMLQIGMAAFRPEAIYFVSCIARCLLLIADTEKELIMSRYAPSSGYYAYGEYVRKGGKVLTANMTIMIIGMREGEKKDNLVLLPPRVSHVDRRTSIMRHLVNFVQQSIGELEEANERYRRLARHDLLTGLLNRGTTDETLELMVSDAEAQDMPLSVLMMDIDNFKGINDSFGHDVGDRALKLVARVLRDETRHGIDMPGRMGGDEFFVVLYCTEEAAAAGVARRIRQSIEDLGTLPDGRRMTASIGVATLLPGDTAQELFKRADQALYHAKREGGKNAVSVAQHEK